MQAVSQAPVDARFGGADSADLRTSVGVVIPTFNQARYLADAIHSVLKQTYAAQEIIVVDDGSSDDPASIVDQFQEVRLIRQENRGTSAARNKGLCSCTANYVVFLDADDRLLPGALEAGLAWMTTRPDCAFVYGGHRSISEDGRPLGDEHVGLIEDDAHLSLLRRNLVGPPATALFRRDQLLAVNGFDESVKLVEDYDLILRLAQRYPVASHPDIVAEYRRHGNNLTNDSFKYLNACLQLLDRHEARITLDRFTRAALREGRADIRTYYVQRMLNEAYAHWRAHRNIRILLRELVRAAQGSPRVTTRWVGILCMGRIGRNGRAAGPLQRPRQ